jgi:hypothetical protein
MGCDAVWLLLEPTFRMNLSPIIRVTRICEIGRTLAVTRNGISPILLTLMMEAILSSEKSVLTSVTRRHIPEDGILFFVFTFMDLTKRILRAKQALPS